MTDENWALGLAVLLSSLPDRDLSPEMAQIRGKAYRQDLGHLTDAEWDYAVKVARRSCRFFPTISELLDFASECQAMFPAVKLLPERAALTPEEFREGWGIFRKTMREQYGIDVDADLGRKPS